MIDRLLNQTAVAVLNRMLGREAWAREKLAPFADRVVRLEAPPFSLQWVVAEGGTLAASEDGAPAVTIGVAVSSLPFALLDPQAASRDVRLQGDAEFAQALSFVLQNLRPEPEEELSRFVGDAAAMRIVGFVRMSASHWRELAERMLDNTANYIVTENPMVVGRDEVAAFVQEVARLRDDVARLEKRIDLVARPPT
ncbi:MAG TPA: SCP2 sterol-binding domain-containing protein [Burkholderiaceae bacterium]|nr:SCP2 sterol-binding domain-containing protein [Burkholderiaceae bacterium]